MTTFYKVPHEIWLFLLLLSMQTFVLMKTSWRCLEDVLKTSSRHLQDILVKTNIFVLAICLQDVFKTSWKNVFKASSRRLQDILKTSSWHLQDVFKMYHQVKLFLLTRLWEAFNIFLRRSFPKTVIYRGICLSNTISDKFMVSEPNLQ